MKPTLALLAGLTLATPALAQQYITSPWPNQPPIYVPPLPASPPSYTATTMPRGGGWSSTTWQGSDGSQMTCTTMPRGGGWSSTQCQ